MRSELEPALAAPVAAIGALELAKATVATAFAIGAISVVQRDDFQRQISDQIERIGTATDDVVKASIEDVTVLLKTIHGKAKALCSPLKHSGDKLGPTCKASPEECCVDFLHKFKGRVDKERGGYKVFKGLGGKHNKVECCLEWDRLHGGFEIFDKNGNHLGERGCDDLSDDPCDFTKSRGSHAKPNSSNHRPRSSACGH